MGTRETDKKMVIKFGRREDVVNNKTVTLLHVVIPNPQDKLNFDSWRELFRYLNRNFSSRLNWSLYSGGPVYEYRASDIDLESALSSFLKNKGLLNIEFSVFDHTSSSTLGELPPTHQQHLAL